MLSDTEIDQVIDEDFLGYHHMSPMGIGKPVPAEYYEHFNGLLPRPILRAWERFGFDGFSNGKLWLTDPIEYAPAIDAWLNGLDLPFNDTWHCLTQSALGRLALWGEKTGKSLSINVPVCTIWPNRDAAEKAQNATRRDRQALSLLSNPRLDVNDSEKKTYIESIIRNLGELEPGQMYAYSIPLNKGGEEDLDNLTIVDAIPYLIGVANSTKRTLGADLLAENRASIDSFLSHLSR
ncbi:MAG: GAD-like domain-containing protein [Actinomycetaceae bacterium]|nr:GAD-like domain-containing protein [Actinomycetaceae bacterium]